MFAAIFLFWVLVVSIVIAGLLSVQPGGPGSPLAVAPLANASAQKTLGRQQATGLLLISIEDNSPASEGGLMIGDILVGLSGQPVSDPDELLARLSGSQVGSALAVEVLRGGQLTRVSVTVGERK